MGLKRAGWLLALVALAGCELVVDFDRDRIMDDAGADMGAAGDLGPGEDMGPGDVDMGTDMGPIMCADVSECDDSVDCTTDECTDSFCVNTPDDTVCDDANACTADTCELVGGCANTSICSIDDGGGALTLDLTTVVTIPSVMAGADGFVAVFMDDGTTLLGSTAVAAGMTNSVEVQLSEQLTSGQMIVIRLYEDAGVIGTFEPGTDPVANDGADIEVTLTVDIPTDTPDVEVTISGDNTDYTFATARPATFPVSSLDGPDPDITLVRGLRYRVINTTPSAHPFELITDNMPGTGGDAPQLVEGATAGTLEADASIGWVDAGGTLEFTVSPAFEGAIDAYRCGIHIGEMRGDVAYADL